MSENISLLKALLKGRGVTVGAQAFQRAITRRAGKQGDPGYLGASAR